MPRYNTCPISGTFINVPDPWFTTISNRKKPFIFLNQKTCGKKVPIRGIRKIGSKPAQKGT